MYCIHFKDSSTHFVNLNLPPQNQWYVSLGIITHLQVHYKGNEAVLYHEWCTKYEQ